MQPLPPRPPPLATIRGTLALEVVPALAVGDNGQAVEAAILEPTLPLLIESLSGGKMSKALNDVLTMAT